MEIKLYGVARGSLHELLNDYLDYMRTRNIQIWNQSHPRFAALRRTCTINNDSAYYMNLAPKLDDTELCNMNITLIYQTISMINKLIEKAKLDFLANGGIKEQMHRARIDCRNNNPQRQ